MLTVVNNIVSVSLKTELRLRSTCTAMLLSALRVAITQFNEDSPQEVLETLNKLFGNQPALFHEAGTAAGDRE